MFRSIPYSFLNNLITKRETIMKQLSDKTVTTFAKRTRTRVGTWNVRTLYQTGKLEQLAAEAEKLKVHILGLSETRWTGFGEKKLATGQCFLYSGNSTLHEKGVGFLLSPAAYKGLMEWQPINERIITARFKSQLRNVTIIQCYAPTEVTQYAAKEAFYEQLTDTLNRVHKKDVVLLLGDMNAQIGSDNGEIEHIMGKHALGSMTENGELFTEFCDIQDLVIGGSLFPHKRSHKVTWFSPDHVTENQIDHICISRRYRRSLENVRNKRSADIGSDHHLVIAEFKLHLCRAMLPSKKIGKRFDTKKLKDPETQKAFIEELQSNFGSTQLENADVNMHWNKIRDTYVSASNKILGVMQTDRKEWMSNETWEKVESRRQAKGKLNNARTRNEKKTASDNWSRIDKEVKKLCKRDQTKWADDLASEAEVAARTGNLRALYESTRRLSGTKNKNEVPVKNKQGKLLSNEREQMERWFEHFSELFAINNDDPVLHQTKNVPKVRKVQRISTTTPSISEIEEAIASMKSNKAPGIDQITAEMLKADCNTSARILHPIFKKIWEDEVFPEDWLQGVLIKVPKKGDLSNCDNWRGIMLLSCPLKIFCKIILRRLEKKVNETLRETQAGYRAGRSGIDHINTLRIIIEQIVEWQEVLHLVFVDFKKAFDSLIHEKIWDSLKRKGVPEKLINLIKTQYARFTCRVLHKGGLSEPIPCESGVRQGCILSPLIFLIVLDEVLSFLDESKSGIQWSLRGNEHLEDLDFADDIVLMSTKRNDMQKKLCTLEENAERVGLQINSDKTKSLYIGSQQPPTYSLNNKQIDRVETFTYLGSQITTDGGAREDVKVRIRKAQGAFGQLKNIWKSKNLSLHTKIRIFNSNVKSVLLYGCETWLVTDSLTRKIQVFVNRCLRRILGIYWPNTISNHDLHQKCHQEPVELDIRRRKWGWIGHTLRKDASTIARQALDWNPQGRRKRGAPKRTWKRSLDIEIQKIEPNCSWKRVKTMANDRKLWKEIVSHLCD